MAGIYNALQILYSDAQLADTWVKRPNSALGGKHPRSVCALAMSPISRLYGLILTRRGPLGAKARPFAV
jgi:hypothetical protein